MASTWRSSPSYGDNNFKGNGRLLCAACQTPVREHRTGFPCPTLGVGTFTVEKPITRARTIPGEESKETRRRRESRRRKREEMERETG